MARVAYLSRDDLPDADQSLLDRPITYYRALAHHPDALRTFARVGAWIRWESDLEPGLRELVLLQVAHAANSGYEFAHHVKLAQEFGVEIDLIDRLFGPETSRGAAVGPTGLHEALQVAASLTVEGDISDADWAALLDAFGTREAIEIVMFVGYYNHVVRVVRALRIDLEPEYDGILERYPSPAGSEAWR